jgi:outer membrane protein assembly factor BamB
MIAFNQWLKSTQLSGPRLFRLRGFCHVLAKSLVFPLLVIMAWIPQASQAQPASQSSDKDWPMYQHDAAHTGRTPATVPNDDPLYLQWAYAFGERVEIEAQPIIAAGVIYQGVMNGEMHAIDADTGAKLWIAQPGGPIPHTAAAYGERVYFGSLDGNVYALSTPDGSTAWKFSTGGPVISAPAVVDGRLYIGSNDGNLYALDAATGSKLWSVQTGGPVVSSPAVVGGKVYFGSEDLTARCADAVTGALIWDTPLYGAGMHNTHPVVSDDGNVVIFLTVKGGGSS